MAGDKFGAPKQMCLYFHPKAASTELNIFISAAEPTAYKVVFRVRRILTCLMLDSNRKYHGKSSKQFNVSQVFLILIVHCKKTLSTLFKPG